MKYPVSVIANRMRNISGQDLCGLRLQKFIYFAEGWHLALTGESLIEEDLLVGTYGPVFKEIHLNKGDIINVDFRTDQLLEKIYREYGPLSTITLSMIAAKNDSPWGRALKEGLSQIPKEWVRKHFEDTLNGVPCLEWGKNA